MHSHSPSHNRTGCRHAICGPETDVQVSSIIRGFLGNLHNWKALYGSIWNLCMKTEPHLLGWVPRHIMFNLHPSISRKDELQLHAVVYQLILYFKMGPMCYPNTMETQRTSDTFSNVYCGNVTVSISKRRYRLEQTKRPLDAFDTSEAAILVVHENASQRSHWVSLCTLSVLIPPHVR